MAFLAIERIIADAAAEVIVAWSGCEPIVAAAAQEKIVAIEAPDFIGSAATENGVIATAAGEHVVAVAAFDEDVAWKWSSGIADRKIVVAGAAKNGDTPNIRELKVADAAVDVDLNVIGGIVEAHGDLVIAAGADDP